MDLAVVAIVASRNMAVVVAQVFVTKSN
jgi:hypothetical protein